MFAQVTYPTKGSLLSSCDQPTVSIPAVSNSVPLLSDCRFRPALPQDRRSIRLLLHTAPPADSAQQPLLSLRIGGLLALLLCGLLLLGGLQLLLYGTLTLCVVAFLSWLNSRLFEDWQNYWVVEWVDAPNGRVIACGQLSHYPIFSVLSDVVVAPRYRQQGIGSFLVTSMVDIARTRNQPLYLACKPERVKFYQRLGFVAIKPQLLPSSLNRALGLRQHTQLLPLRLSKLR